MTTPANFDQLRELAQGTQLESYVSDEKELEALLLKEMQASPDPVTREIGAGIAGGSMTWRTVVSSGVYTDYIERGMAAMRDLDFGATFGALAEEEPPRPAAPPPNEHDEDEPFNRSVLKRRR